MTFSTAKLYKDSRVARKLVQVVPNRANTIVTYPPALNFAPNQQVIVASGTSSVNGISRVRIAKKSSVNPALQRSDFDYVVYFDYAILKK